MFSSSCQPFIVGVLIKQDKLFQSQNNTTYNLSDDFIKFTRNITAMFCRSGAIKALLLPNYGIVTQMGFKKEC
ncbi:CLUMA_CG020266, isoform A [Clunio marinus]|uniref:CLUMA_CG020266, isoform A n=1 Tax=Clunio marinus TaxID=568069 RepID=A0A1J1J4G8_9DIPT|nr:CLUMA_CG020266, isoform A [Clunio marinus]